MAKRHWTDGVAERLAKPGVAVGGDLHRLEMAMAERQKLLEALKEIARYAGRVAPVDLKEIVAIACVTLGDADGE